MEVEKAMKFLEDYLDKEDRKFVSEYRLMFLESIGRLIEYIKRESVPKAVVEEQIGKINELLPDIDYHDIKEKQEREYYKKEYMKYITARNYLQGLLNKGE